MERRNVWKGRKREVYIRELSDSRDVFLNIYKDVQENYNKSVCMEEKGKDEKRTVLNSST